jgi:aspartate kinase
MSLELNQTRLIVQKYGGATLATPAHIRAAAERIGKLHQAGHPVVAIVSAMGSTTNELIALAHQVSSKPTLRELDMLLTTGERVSMALLTMALQDLGCEAISFTGSQAGILTDESHVNALIKDVKAFRVSDALKQGKVVVLAGFQGVSPVTKEITTLGRGGTDTTAVAMSVFLKAYRCEILKEVPAVFTADPRLVPDARPLAHLTYSQLADMCFWGAKVLHYRSVELAGRHEVPLYVGPARDSEKGSLGTTLKTGEPMFESTEILALNSHEKVLQWRHTGSTFAAHAAFQHLLQTEKVPAPQILGSQSRLSGGQPENELTVTGPSEVMDRLEEVLRRGPAGRWTGDLATVTCTCTGTTSIGLFGKVAAALENQKLSPNSISISAQSLTLIVPRADRSRYLQALHDLIAK